MYISYVFSIFREFVEENCTWVIVCLNKSCTKVLFYSFLDPTLGEFKWGRNIVGMSSILHQRGCYQSWLSRGQHTTRHSIGNKYCIAKLISEYNSDTFTNRLAHTFWMNIVPLKTTTELSNWSQKTAPYASSTAAKLSNPWPLSPDQGSF